MSLHIEIFEDPVKFLQMTLTGRRDFTPALLTQI